MLGAMAVTVPEIDWFDPTVLQHQLDGHQAATRERVRDVLCRPEFAPPVAMPTPAYREQVLAWCEVLAQEGLPAYAFPKEVGGQRNPSAAVAMFETLAYGDLSLLVKYGVQFGLWGGAVQQLGTERHHERYLGAIMRLELPGCFAMTETGHGSNVQQLETTATYDAETPGVRRHDAGRAGTQGVHRQRRLPRSHGGGVRAADRRG